MSSSLWLFGLLLGMRHALEPDHLAAVTTLVVEERRMTSGAVLGGLWGVGHTGALLAVATVLAICGVALPPTFATLFELAVAFMLVGIGLRSLWARPAQAHHAGLSQDFENGPGKNEMPKNEVSVRGQDREGHGHRGERSRFARRSLLVGTVHGLAGSGALTALVASRLGTTPGRLLYVGVFGLGSIIGMALLSGAAGWPLARLGRSPQAVRGVSMITGVFAVGLGIVWGVPLVRSLLS